MELAAYLVLGLVIGVLSGFFGVGGGFILTPVLLLLGVAPVSAIATSLMYTIGTSISGVIAHFRIKTIRWKMAATIGLSGIAATQAALPFVLFLEERALDRALIPIFYLILLGYFALSMLKRSNSKQAAAKPSFVKMVLIGFFGGFTSATLGVGGGFIIVPLLIGVLSMPPKEAVGTSLLSVFFIVTSGFISYSLSAPIDYMIGLFLIIGALIGGQIGAFLINFYDDHEIKRMLAFLYIATWFSVLLKLFDFDYAGLAVLSTFTIGLLLMFFKKTVLQKA